MNGIAPDLQQQLNQASQLVSRGDFTAAATFCQAALQAMPEEPLLHIRFGQALGLHPEQNDTRRLNRVHGTPH